MPPADHGLPHISRRHLIRLGALGATALALPLHRGLAADQVKVAGVFGTPIEEPWVNQIHVALLKAKGELDEKKLNEWLGTLLRTKGQDIFRMKGVLAVKGRDMRFVFQGVHMLMDGRPDRPWGNDPRENALIFIGRNLNRQELNEGFKSCLAT